MGACFVLWNGPEDKRRPYWRFVNFSDFSNGGVFCQLSWCQKTKDAPIGMSGRVLFSETKDAPIGLPPPMGASFVATELQSDFCIVSVLSFSSKVIETKFAEKNDFVTSYWSQFLIYLTFWIYHHVPLRNPYKKGHFMDSRTLTSFPEISDE